MLQDNWTFKRFFFLWILLIFPSSYRCSSEHAFPLENITTDEVQSFMTDILSRNSSYRSCPAPTFPVQRQDCDFTSCKSDEDCKTPNQSCCFNGCKFTCLDRIMSAPVIDWEDENEAPLFHKPDDLVLRCTTSVRPAPSEPVGCPLGFSCRVDDFGDPLERRKNSGVCVPDILHHANGGDESLILKERISKQTVFLPGGCILSELQFKNMQDFKSRPYVEDCFCLDGSVECRVSENQVKKDRLGVSSGLL